MKLEDAVKEAYKNKPKEIVGYSIDGGVVNLDCEKDGSIFPARLFLEKKPYRWDSVYDVEYLDNFVEEVKKYLD